MLNKNKIKKNIFGLFFGIFVFYLILFFLPQNVLASSSGTYISDVYNTGGPSNFINVSWNNTGVGSVQVSLRAGNLNPPTDGTWTLFTNNSNPSLTGQYIQYRIYFNPITYSTTVNDANTTINSFNLIYRPIFSSQVLISSKYNTVFSANKISSVSWDEINLPVGSSVKFYLETAPTEAGLVDNFQEIINCAKTGQTVTCLGIPNAFQAGDDDIWFHYKVELFKNGVGAFPIIDNIKISYNGNLKTPLLNKIDIETAKSYQQTGSFVSKVYDTTFNIWFNAITINEDITGGGVVTKVRTCNDNNCLTSPPWAACPPLASGNDISAGGCVSDGQRYIQYHLDLDRGTDKSTTPSVNSININFTQPTVYFSGTAFNIVANLSDPESDIANIPTPIAKIYDSLNNQVGGNYVLYDDGSHNDGSAGDRVFGTNPITINTLGVYTIELMVTNNATLQTDINPAGTFLVN